MRRILKVLSLVASFSTAGLSAIAAPLLAVAPTPPGQQADIAQIEAYLNGITTATAAFTLVGPDGQQTKGQFYLNRPDRLRFEYTEPKGNLLIADGNYVIFWDAEQKEASNLPIDQTPLAFLLKPHISLSDGVGITRFEHAAGVIRVTLVQSSDADAGSVTIAFADQPLALRGWRLIDGQGQITDVSFEDWKLGMPLDAALFHFKAPESGKRHR
jgi:outer membrane lipoprotein-sorting protein